MATKDEKADAKPESKPAKSKDETLTHAGVAIQGKVITGKKNRLTQKEQGQLARGEIDSDLNPIDKGDKPTDLANLGAPKTSKPEMTLYQGDLTLHAIAGATGQPVSIKMTQAEPTTEDGVFHSMQAYHPSAIRDTFKIDAENKTDPTLRTYLEK